MLMCYEHNNISMVHQILSLLSWRIHARKLIRENLYKEWIEISYFSHVIQKTTSSSREVEKVVKQWISTLTLYLALQGTFKKLQRPRSYQKFGVSCCREDLALCNSVRRSWMILTSIQGKDYYGKDDKNKSKHIGGTCSSGLYALKLSKAYVIFT